MNPRKASERRQQMKSTADAEADARVKADETALTASRRTSLSLAAAHRAFWRHPSPWMIGGTLLVLSTWRVVRGDWRMSDAWAPLILLALFPIIEWLIHVFVLHSKPRKVAGLSLDTLLARKHREHHADPRDVALVYIPWKTLIWVIIGYNTIAVLAFPRVGQALTFMTAVAWTGLLYEWSHYLIHSDYQPRSRAYKAIWRNHRLHHYKNEHYWFTVTTTGSADRLMGTYPDPSMVRTSPTAKSLHSTT
ncbi:sterol desaturase family protein [Streptomyces sp. NPDC087908]|uniref:sterol desaturase family protein n=1 Tax=Streptomyces sp. NPDC087908 TaxID=3365820 RepID=UPI0037F75EE0